MGSEKEEMKVTDFRLTYKAGNQYLSVPEVVEVPGNEKKRLVVALGGNAILQQGQEGTLNQQIANLSSTAETIAQLANQGYQLAITHGNGPQVGNILLQNEFTRDKVPPLPLDACGAESQGLIGYMIQQAVEKAIERKGADLSVASLVTRTLVNDNDPAFSQPTKPIGPFYSQEAAAKLKEERGYAIVEDADRGYRRVVASPEPEQILEKEAIKALLEVGTITVAAGGGGIPVIKSEQGYEGVEAVIDKDLTAEKLAEEIEADRLLILTDVTHAMLNYGQLEEEKIEKMTPATAKKYEREGHFAQGSMQPKVEACRRFVETTNNQAVIGSIDQFGEVVKGTTGTKVANQSN